MDSIQVIDRRFRPYLRESQILERVRAVAADIARDYTDRNPIFLAVLNGSFVFAADLMRCLEMPCEIAFVKMASYAGMNTTGEVKQLLGLSVDIEGRDVIVVEDIVDTGFTMEALLGLLQTKKPASVNICSLLVKPDKLQVDGLPLNYRCFDIPNDFIIGYGLDYDGQARNLRDIYVVEE